MINHNTIIATLLVRDEIDIIRDTIEHHIDQGVSYFIATDNGSIDGTREILDEYKEIMTIIDEPPGSYNQELWLQRMIDMGIERYPGCWMIHIDADEFYYLDKLYELNVDAVITKEVYDHLPVPGLDLHFKRSQMPHFLVMDDQHYWRCHPLESLTNVRRVPKSKKLGRTIHRLKPNIYPAQGRHTFRSKHHFAYANIKVCHYQTRSYEQFEKTTINGGMAYLNYSGPKSHGSHWREWYKLYQEGKLRDLYNSKLLTDPELYLSRGIITC